MNYKTIVFFFIFLYGFIFHFPTFAHATSLLIDPSDARTDDRFIMETTIRSYDDSLVVRKPYDVRAVGRYDTIFVYGEHSSKLPASLEEQLQTYEGRIILIGKVPETQSLWKNFQTDGTVDVLALQGEPMQSALSIERVLPNKHLHTLVEGERYGATYPYIVTNDYGVYYIASSRVEGLKQYVLNDLLAQLYTVPFEHRAYIRLEGIDRSSDAKQLQQVTDYLEAQHVPILLSVNLDLNENKTKTIKKNEPLLKLLRKLQKNGARIILNAPLQHMDQSIRYLMHQKLYPFAIETTDLSFSYERYKEINSFTNLYFGPLTSSHTGKIQHILPSTINGLEELTLYPETLGYVQQEDGPIFRTWQHKLQLLEQLQMSTLGLSYHPYLGVEPLKEVVEQMKAVNGVQWMEWDRYETTTKTSTATIHFGADHSIRVTKDQPFYDQWLYIWENKTTETVLWILVGLVGAFVTLFIFYIVRMRVRLRKRLFRERSS